MGWSRAAAVSQCPPGTAREVLVAGRIIGLFNVDGTIYALDGVCPHQGGPLGKGSLCGHTLTCPWHGWQFDVRSGRHLLSPAVVQPRFQTRIEGEDIYVLVDDAAG